ncbi:MAG TPA: PqqD family peptide modification chaperone [Trebonia sp.]|nr:PqqD family peptide modification chaperone [Trebonia sp.]
MTLLDMQRVFSRILTDKAFRQSFINGDAPSRAMYQLTERELESLRRLRWDRVGLQAEFLAHRRLELAFSALPLTGLLLHGQLHDQLDRFCAEHPPAPQAGGPVWAEAVRLCQFVGKLVAEGTLRPAWAWDLIRYERCVLDLTVSSESAASAIRVAELNAGASWPPADSDDLVPVAGPHAKIAQFSYPLPDLTKLLRSGGLPDDERPLDLPLLILFYQRARGPVHVVRINEATAALIDACDGDRTIADVADHLSRTVGSGAKARTRVAAAIAQLRDAGVVGLRRGRKAAADRELPGLAATEPGHDAVAEP